MADKTAGQTQVAWALLSEGVSSARLRVHELRHLIQRGQKIVDSSPEKDHIYQVAGDLIMAAPNKIEALETDLDRLSYALSVLGTNHLRERLPMSDRAMVDQATHRARPFTTPSLERSTSRVAYRYLLRKAEK